LNRLLVLVFALACATNAHAVYTGLELGYLIDSEDEYIAARLGFEVFPAEAGSHNLEAEVGYFEDSESFVKIEILPITVNYRLEVHSAEKWSYNAGVGAGMSRVRVKASGYGFSSSDNAFTAQAFAGASYKFSPSLAFTLGVRYIWIDDIELGSLGGVEVGDDVAFSAGVRFQF